MDETAVKVYITPDIPPKKLDAAIAGIAPDANPDYVIAVLDDTLFGTAKTGAVVLGDRIYFHDLFSRMVVEYSSILSTEKTTETIRDRKGNTTFKINRLSAILSTMANSARRTTNSIDYAKREQLLCRLPMNIDEGKIEVLASGASKHNIRAFIFDAYNQVKTDETGAQHAHCLNTELSAEILERLYNILTEIGYYKVVENGIASVRSMIGI